MFLNIVNNNIYDCMIIYNIHAVSEDDVKKEKNYETVDNKLLQHVDTLK